MFQYLFILGKSTHLCQKELEFYLKRHNISYNLIFSAGELFLIETDTRINGAELENELAGVVKVGMVFLQKDNLSDIASIISEKLIKTQKNKLVFGISLYNINVDIYPICKEIKSKLLSAGIAPRYILPQTDNKLSSVVVKKQHIEETIIINYQNSYYFSHTEAVQNFEDWNYRDYDRPYADPKSGMLPPKVARMMINLTEGRTLLDPFCGMGTILAEGLSCGYKVIGSDKSPATIASTEKNLSWFIKKLNPKSSDYNLYCSDAVDLSFLKSERVDTIVTEPYLGPNWDTGVEVSKQKLENIITGLEKLYFGCLKTWHNYIADNGTIVLIIPSYRLFGTEFLMNKTIDNLAKFGYIIEVGPLSYARPQAVVKRNIYKLRKV